MLKPRPVSLLAAPIICRLPAPTLNHPYESVSVRNQQPEDLVTSSVFEKRRQTKPKQIVFSATVAVGMREAVETLFFFNPRQPLLRSAISATVQRTGVPRIVELDGRVWIDVPSHSMQCLFACDSALKPVGVVLYDRPSPDVLCVSHLAVDPAYASGGGKGGGLGLLLIERVRQIARRIKGISRIQVPYRSQCFLRV